jgi:uncharacterized membrane protein
MAFCSNCGTEVQEGVQFCPACGASTAAPAAPQPGFAGAGYANLAQDAEANKVWGILSYIIFLIPLLAAPKNSKYARYHVNQGLSLFIVALGLSIIIGIISAIVSAIALRSAVYYLGGGFAGLIIVSILSWAEGIAVLVFAILGIVHAAKGELKPLPVISKINILKVQL